MARVHVRVDEAGTDEQAARIELGVNASLEEATHVDDAVVLVDHHALGDERVAAAGEADDPPAADQRPHADCVRVT